jgi:two-component system response regulator MprA
LDAGQLLRFEDLELDPSAHEADRGGRLLELTRTEFLLLELLMNHPRQVLTRSAIFDRVRGYDFGSSSNSLELRLCAPRPAQDHRKDQPTSTSASSKAFRQ